MRGGLNCGKLKGKDVCWGKKISLGAILGLFLFFLGQRAAALSVQETWESRDAGIVQQEKEAAEERTENLKENKRRKTVALTFDDGPHETWTPLLLDGLEERGVKATFFLMGENIAGKEEIVKRMSRQGHLIGNHSFKHVQLTKAGMDEVCASFEKTGDIIEELT